ncbi:MAG: ABC transporter ATP-binding protein [Pirellulaceae bacterium]|nr:MAG: ABC transporter ATP-binding protein [Pirellulaceae bacterium]
MAAEPPGRGRALGHCLNDFHIQRSHMTHSAAIEIQGLEKEYREGVFFKRRFKALHGIEFSVRRGEVFGLLGPNGAGKTTLIKILLGIVRGSGGEARLLGEPAGSRSARRRIGYLPENLVFPAHHTALSAMRLYGRLSYVPEEVIRRRAAELLELVGLVGREREHVRRYSKGMRQRLGLAQALLHDPELLILDEPTDGLDPLGRAQIRRLIHWLKEQGKTVFLNSHILQEVELVCDRVAILVQGRLRGVGTPDELMEQLHAQSRHRVRLVLSGAEEHLQQLASRMGASLAPLPDGGYDLHVQAETQADVDRLVDAARRDGISIHRLERTRMTLEELFLSAVQRHEDDGCPSSPPEEQRGPGAGDDEVYAAETVEERA